MISRFVFACVFNHIITKKYYLTFIAVREKKEPGYINNVFIPSEAQVLSQYTVQ